MQALLRIGLIGVQENGLPGKLWAVGDKVHLTHISTRSMPHPRYRGRTGTIVGKQGGAYIIEVGDYNATKRLVIEGVHLTKVV